MNLMRAFSVMLGGVTAADASARQVQGILGWREYVHVAVKRGSGFPGADRAAAMPSSGTHSGWRAAAAAILDDLHGQAGSADQVQAEAEAQAEAADAEAEAAEKEAAEMDAQAAEFLLAAEANAALGPIGLAAAAACAAEAAARAAAAAAARARAAAARTAAADARARAGTAMQWGIAARDAHTYGDRLVALEDSIAIPVGEAIAAAGGVKEVYGGKHALSTDGPRRLAVRGGAR